VTERVEAEFKNNITDYRTIFPALLWYNAFILVSNGIKRRFGAARTWLASSKACRWSWDCCCHGAIWRCLLNKARTFFDENPQP